MATEDERYRKSSQYRLWSFTPSKLQEMRRQTNTLAAQNIAPRLPANPPPEALSPEDELILVKYFTCELIRAAQFCELPSEIRSTAAIFFRRFYVTNSIMTYPPTELLKTSLFFGCKAEGFYIKLDDLTKNFPNTSSEHILAGEFLLCQGVRFAFDVRHPFRALEGAILELRRRKPDMVTRIDRAHIKAREILKFSSILTDAYFHYAPSQIMMAALHMADKEMVDILLPSAAGESKENDNTARPTGAHEDMRVKIIQAIESCRAMLEEEPPDRLEGYWKTPDRPLLKKLRKCRDPDRSDLVALQRARREQAASKERKQTPREDGAVFGDGDQARDSKRRRTENADDVFGGPL